MDFKVHLVDLVLIFKEVILVDIFDLCTVVISARVHAHIVLIEVVYGDERLQLTRADWQVVLCRQFVVRLRADLDVLVLPDIDHRDWHQHLVSLTPRLVSEADKVLEMDQKVF